MPLETTTLDRRWLAKMIIFFCVLVFFGFYGLYDATIAYPNRGMRHAAFLEFQYLDAARERGLLDRRLIIEDPAAEYQRLRNLERHTGLDVTRYEWLRALSLIGPWSLRPSALNPDNTSLEPRDEQYAQIGGVRGRFEELRDQWTTAQGPASAPKALASYDIPVQWLFVIVGFGGGLWMAGLFLAVSRVKFRWDASTQTLHLPLAGTTHTLTPQDIEEFDKRKWSKFLVFLRIRPDHPTLGGRELRLDLLRYARLEGWILDMERTAFPEHFAEEEAQQEDPETTPAESDEDKVSI